jgi:broad specificity phosphatase PhoE
MKLFLIRHSKSCSNLMREDEKTREISREIRDPGLSRQGAQMVQAYGPALRKRLTAAGFDLKTAFLASSGLARAATTAKLLFGREPETVGHIKEHGNIPENTSTRRSYQKPNWPAFLKDLEAKAKGRDAIVVVHGSYLTDFVVPKLTGSTLKERMNNLDGLLVTGALRDGKLTVDTTEIIRRPSLSVKGEDRCNVADTRKIARISKMVRRTQKQRQRQRQRGGGVSMPLAYYQDGAQFNGTSASETGVGLAGTSAAWVKAPLSQTGGRRRTQRQNQRGGFGRLSRRNQRGGFAPGIMGAFVVNGARLAPMALYLGRKMFSSRTGPRIPPTARRRTLRRKSRRS